MATICTETGAKEMAEKRGSRTHQGTASAPSTVLKTARHTGADALPILLQPFVASFAATPTRAVRARAMTWRVRRVAVLTLIGP